jgi:hypothetical protein
MKTDLLHPSAPRDSAAHPSAPWDRFVARMLAASLDRQLAAGHLPLSSPALAIRARQIVSPAGRRELVQDWIHVLDLAGRSPVPISSHGPLCRGAVAAAERDVREMIGVLASGLPIAPRGAALARRLLIDGTGPLHNHRSPLDLTAAVRAATRQMDSFADARPGGTDSDVAACYQ